ncbi:MAG TPA: DUF4160 domain-containing protein [Turneriella sp.]|nr:DUF4160 domain-containing protein [Turneriella sp.]
MPTVYAAGNRRFFFNNREESRRHIHRQTPDGVAKFWLEPIVALASYYSLKDRELNEIEIIVKEKKDEFIAA